MIRIEKIKGPASWYKSTVKTVKETVEFEGPKNTIEYMVNRYLFNNGYQVRDLKY